MKLNEIAEKLRLRNLTPEIPGEANAEAAYGHSTDLFSDVLANAPRGSVLVTLHVQMNVLDVAIPAGVMAVIFAWNRLPDEAVVKKATEEGIWLYVADDSTFNIVGQLYALGLGGQRGCHRWSPRTLDSISRADPPRTMSESMSG